MRLTLVSLLILASCQAERAEPVQASPVVAPEADPSSASRGDLGWSEIRDDHYEADQWRWQYPSWAHAEVEGTELERDYDLRFASNPFMLHGDFDGDGQTDVAAWVESRSDPAQIGVVVVHRSRGAHYFPAGGSNWEVYPRGEVGEGVGEGAPPTLRGDALLFVKPEATSSLRYWNGSEYVAYHQGD